MSHGGPFPGYSRMLPRYFLLDPNISGEGHGRTPVRTTPVPIEWRTASADPVWEATVEHRMIVRDHPGFPRILPPPSSPFQRPLGVEIALLRDAIMSRELGEFASLVPPSSLYGTQRSPADSKLTEEEQNGAVKKLRRVVYAPASLSSLGSRVSLYYRDRAAAGRAKRAEEEGKRCAVCLEDFEAKEQVMLTPCDHMFHEDCIVPWVRSNGNCPVCRFSLSDRSRLG
ncbi:unnamed protein product [Linum trigynum]|uniref:RING-type domain-containing protein n=1 Tax=Linum trigynum TaxID=586398 RepID=A0AAV2F7S1_9ROSI